MFEDMFSKKNYIYFSFEGTKFDFPFRSGLPFGPKTFMLLNLLCYL